ncbi:alpha/beta hydrolase family protein [Mucilaginibacter sp. OK098]|uniref:alpha/beta hydrolase family protein n=1 Tax=Mucilaginibacter sp. OK098 TaxID=1855297 RepID=UPI000912D989|nr:prolyl oligopeptidase family serine peptidase [Mucilaginibacter sp. OK098]SHL96495.1 Dipeptidyl aminopeptidase/acylaminoacyl peptidase [Mucilaginibacter sp. OK098]
MKVYKFLIGILIIAFGEDVYCQSKKSIDFEAIDNWTTELRPTIAPDGKYFTTTTDNLPRGCQTLTLSSTDRKWVRKYVSKNYIRVTYSDDSNYCLIIHDDSLSIEKLGHAVRQNITRVANFELVKGNHPLILYTTKDNPEQTIIYNLNTHIALSPLNCKSRFATKNGKYLIYQNVDKEEGLTQLHLFNFETLIDHLIWSGSDLNEVKLNIPEKSIAFIAKEKAANEFSMMFYTIGNISAKRIATEKDIPLKENFSFDSFIGFSSDGSQIYFKVKKNQTSPTPSPEKAKVDIWGFNDPMIQSASRAVDDRLIFGLDINMKKFLFLSKSEGTDFDGINENFLFIQSDAGRDYWNAAGYSKIFIVSALNGKRRLIDSNVTSGDAGSYRVSPNGKYVIYFNSKLNNYYSYSVDNDSRINLTNNIKDEWDYHFFYLQPGASRVTLGTAGWIGVNNDVIIKGRYDIWRASLNGREMPISITHQYGMKNGIEFIIPKNVGLASTLQPENKTINLVAFDPKTKRNGFFTVDITGDKAPVQLTMEDYAYYVPWTSHSWGETEFIKADRASVWIVPRQRSSESLNYFVTKDFKHFSPVTNNHPENKYNFIRTKLISWALPSGSISQGVLYQPENFDPSKKYPVIFNYYEEKSNNLNVYPYVERSSADINIPYFVSNGYLVFTPDIKRTKEGAGQDALVAMESAAKYLSSLPYVDGSKLGLNGTSMGGYKTNFIVTHTHLFAAANANADISNVAALDLDIWGNVLEDSFAGAMDAQVELFQFYLGKSIVQNSDLYIKNSPIFYLKDVITPLLIMHNKHDGGSPWSHGLAMYMGLRRLGKPVWMLQYDGASHFLDSHDKVATTDWTIRQKQFFDHYLKGAAAPVWMTKGRARSEKQINDHFELDTTIQTPRSTLGIFQ